MNNIISVAKNRDEIMAAQDIYCSRCAERQYAIFDKLYTKAFEKCVDCTNDDKELKNNGDLIFQIL